MSPPPDVEPHPSHNGAPRRTMLAAERTQLAWWRTAFAVLAVGLAIGKIIPQLAHEETIWPYTVLGAGFGAAATVRLLERCDAFRKPQRFAEILMACECDARGRLGFEERPYESGPRLGAALAAARSVSTEAIALEAQARGLQGEAVGAAIHGARVLAVARLLGQAAPNDSGNASA